MVLNQSGGVDSYDDYYPFGLTMPGRSMSSSADPRYTFTGKEQDVETTLDYGVYPALGGSARYYDSWRGQWLSVDPLEEKYAGWSPYAYSADNPVSVFDIDGKRWVPAVSGAEAQMGFKYAQGLKYIEGPTWSDLNNSSAVCNEVVACSYKPDFPDFPADMSCQAEWFQSHGWFTMEIKNAGEGDAIFFGNPDFGPHHEIIITGVEVVHGVLKFKIVGASSSKKAVKEYSDDNHPDGYYTWDEIRHKFEKKDESFFGIGSVGQTQNNVASSTNSDGSPSASNNNSSSSSSGNNISQEQAFVGYINYILWGQWQR